MGVVMRYESLMLPVMRWAVKKPKLMDLAFRRDPWGNPMSDDVARHPNDWYRTVWKSGPVTYNKSFRRWFVLGYDEAKVVLNHSDASAGDQFRDLVHEIRPYKRFSPTTKKFFEHWMLLQDGDSHQRLRTLVSRTFTPKRIAEWEPLVRQATDDLLASLPATGTIEMVEAFNRPLPVNVIAGVLGIPAERSIWLGEIVAIMTTFLEPFDNLDVEAIDGAVQEFREFVIALAAERVETPTDDLITALALVEADGERLSEDELVANVGLLVFAGHDTTTNMLGNALVALAQHPDQRAFIRANPDQWPNAVEELLRWDTTGYQVVRRLRSDIDLDGTLLPAGADVMVSIWGANRDPRKWEDPFELRLDRPDPHPLSFGHGLHYCVGQALARMELQVALDRLVAELGDYTIDTDAVDWRRSIVLRGANRVPLVRG